MNIIFDVWVLPNYKKKFSVEQEKMLQAIWHFVYDKIFYLMDEIETEEHGYKKEQRHIMVYLTTKPKKIEPHGYSDKLIDKINGSFNEKDSELMWQSVIDALQSLLN
jgi:hypothetical protein